MAKLISFVMCDSVQNLAQPEGQTMCTLSNPQVVLRPQFIPGEFSFGIALGINDIIIQDNNKLIITITDPDGKEIFSTGEQNLKAPEIEDRLEKKYQGFFINVDIRNIPIIAEGEYKLNVFVNGENIGTEIIPIFKRM